MVNIGLISYPLYLWHWPIFSFMFILGKEQYLFWGMVASLVLAKLTYRFIERPRSIKPVLIAIPALVACVVFIPARLHSVDKQEWDPMYGYKKVKGTRFHHLKEVNTAKKILMWGDSHLEQYAPRLREISKKSVTFSYVGGQMPCDCVNENSNSHLVDKWRKDTLKMALSDEYDVIVIGASWNGLKAGGLANLETLLNKLKHKNVYLILDNPNDKRLKPNNLRDRNTGRLKNAEIPYNDKHKRIRLAMLQLVKRIGVKVIDPVPHLVKDGVCLSVYGHGMPIYYDAGHLSTEWVRKRATYIDVILNVNKN